MSSSTELLPKYQHFANLSQREQQKAKRSRRRRQRGILDGSRPGTRRKCAAEVAVILGRRAADAARLMQGEVSAYFEGTSQVA